MNKKFVLYFILITVIFTALLTVGTNTFKENITVAEAVYSPKKVIPGGEIVGIKLFSDGILIVDITDIKTSKGLVCPGKEAGLKKGDYITHVNSEKITSITDFSNKIKNQSSVNIKVRREEKELSLILKPHVSQETNTTRAGLWVRDSTAGIGTVTFYDTDNKKFAALGHPITDADTDTVYSISFAECFLAENFQITKAKRGHTGEITGTFGNDKGIVGSIKTNSYNGVSGNLVLNVTDTPVEVAGNDDIKEGSATLMSNIEGGAVKPYNIKIAKILRGGDNTVKGFTVKITDKTLLNLTGGIIQGMSGSPIIQNGKLIGAVTHVFVNDPTRGYGIFIENMLAEAEKIK